MSHFLRNILDAIWNIRGKVENDNPHKNTRESKMSARHIIYEIPDDVLDDIIKNGNHRPLDENAKEKLVENLRENAYLGECFREELESAIDSELFICEMDHE